MCVRLCVGACVGGCACVSARACPRVCLCARACVCAGGRAVKGTWRNDGKWIENRWKMWKMDGKLREDVWKMDVCMCASKEMYVCSFCCCRCCLLSRPCKSCEPPDAAAAGCAPAPRIYIYIYTHIIWSQFPHELPLNYLAWKIIRKDCNLRCFVMFLCWLQP